VSDWQLHWLEAEGDLQRWRSLVEWEIGAAHKAVSRLISPPRLDILVQRIASSVIPEIGMVGHAYRKSLFALTLDPDNQHFASNLAVGMARRIVHHCLRMAGPGYGRTLGEALVSEGLAGRFVGQLFGNAPEPWERAVDDDTLFANRPDAATLASTSYNHAAWFFGTGGERPRWLGYTLGYQIVGKWLDQTSEVDGFTWANVPADVILASPWPELTTLSRLQGDGADRSHLSGPSTLVAGATLADAAVLTANRSPHGTVVWTWSARRNVCTWWKRTCGLGNGMPL
jgi:hypothetical protein